MITLRSTTVLSRRWEAQGHGIHLFESDNNTINNDGSIETMGHRAFGIYLDESLNNAINNNGSIETEVRGASGIYLDKSLNNTVNNNGSIETMGDFASGISLSGSTTNTINNNGSIKTVGKDSYGISLSAFTTNTVNNNGSIETMGEGAHGILLFASDTNNTINNNGSIKTMGEGAHGIFLFFSDANTINNDGDIFVTGVDSFAVLDDGNKQNKNNTLNLFSRSRIIGRIDFGDGVDTVNFHFKKAGFSSTLSFENTESINLHDDNMVNVGGLTGVYSVVDPTGQSVNGAVLGSITKDIHGILTRRTSRMSNTNPSQLASTRVEPGMMSSSQKSQVWASGFGAHRSRDEDGRVLAYDHVYYGGVAGYETATRQASIGFMAGYAQSDVRTDLTSINTDSESYFVGAYGQKRFASFNLDASLLAGYERYDNDRIVVDNLNKFETAEAAYDSFFLSPSVTLSSEIRVFDKIALRPSVTGIYSVAWYDDYTESGTTRSNLSIDDRFSHALIGKLQIAAAYVFSNGSEIGIRGGGRYRYTINDDVDTTLAGTSFRYAAAGDDTYFAAIAGANARVALMDSINLTANAEYAFDDGIETTLSGQLVLEFIGSLAESSALNLLALQQNLWVTWFK